MQSMCCEDTWAFQELVGGAMGDEPGVKWSPGGDELERKQHSEGGDFHALAQKKPRKGPQSN